MNNVDSYLHKFQQLLRELFQFDCQDLDFGIYRVLNYKRKKVEEFVSEGLPQIVAEAFAQYAAVDRATAERELEQKRQEILSTLGATAFDATGQLVAAFRETPLGRQFVELEQKAKAGRVADELHASVYNDLYTFFSRYYEEGDIFSRPRRGRVEIPFTGHEDVVLHWANKDQYYIKTGEHFKSYRFKVDTTAVEFTLHNVAVEQNNNRGERRYFVFAEESPVTFDDKTKTLTALLEHRPLTEKEKITCGKTEAQKPQNKLNGIAEEAILKGVKDATLKARLAQPVGEDKPSLLLHHLTHFTRKNTTDFFIHKDLRGFLTRELDDFLKTEVVHTDELLAVEHPDVPRRVLLRVQVARRIAGHIIDFLAQVEDFQKRLFEKRKFVVRTEYCITLDRLPASLWDEVLKNKAQLEEWRALYALDDLLKQAKKKRPDRDFLKAHDKLVVDTCHFTEDFKCRMLAAFDDLDAALDGLLIKSENFQALALLVAKYRERVKCIYIDPPYNTGSDEFIYKDNYLHSSWLAMMYDRTNLARELMTQHAAFFSSIDFNEVASLKALLCQVFGDSNFEGLITWRRRHNQPNDRTKMIGLVSEYLLSFARNSVALRQAGVGKIDLTGRFRNPDKDPRGDWASKPWKVGTGQSGTRYKIKTPTGRIYNEEWMGAPKTYEALLKDKRMIFPNNGDGPPRKKYFKSEREEEGQCAPNWWPHDQFGDNASASDQMANLFGKKGLFDNPKPVELVRGVIQVAGIQVDIVMDYFAGSGTTAHSVLRLVREDKKKRFFILVEMAEYLEGLILPRIKKVVFCENWKDGKPADGEGISHFLKYQILEQYEDALNNLELPRAKEGELALKTFGDEYLLRYMLEFETQGSASLLGLERLRHPFAYKLKVQDGNEMVERTVDLVETFNYLLGLHVRKLRELRDGQRLYRVALGNSRNGKNVVVVWRDLEGVEDNKQALQKDRQFIESDVLPALLGKDTKPDRLLVNGPYVVEGAEAIEPEFHRLMFAPIG